MLRSGAPRALLRNLNKPVAPRVAANAFHCQRLWTSRLCTAKRVLMKQPMAPAVPQLSICLRKQTTLTPEQQMERERARMAIDPESVTTTSSTHPLFSEIGDKPQEIPDVDMTAGIKSDIRIIKETFSLREVPKEAYYAGLAGILPYLVTSLSTYYCAFEINRAHTVGESLFMSPFTAELALHVLEPLQIGYGAVIISFLGAIHWGLEWAGYGGNEGYSRYMVGLVAPIVAWPTILLPVETALVSQFLAFIFLYYADAQATKRGQAPPWYGVYRFVLTFFVGATVVMSLVGRGQVTERIDKMPGPADRIKMFREARHAQTEQEMAKLASKADDEEE